MRARRSALARRRQVLGFTQLTLAEHLSVELSTVGRWERGQVDPNPVQLARLARALRVTLDELHDLLYPAVATRWHPEPAVVESPSTAHSLADLLPVLRGPQHSTTSSVGTARLPAGRVLAATSLTVGTFPVLAPRDDRVVFADSVAADVDGFVNASDRGLLVTANQHRDRASVRAVDASVARRRLAHQQALSIPEAFELDDFTAGVLWAATALDEAAVHDDDLLQLGQHQLGGPSTGDRALPADVRAQLSGGSHMLLGSSTCAEFILDHVHQLDAPVYWTREQRGEEASGWLFFRHKLAYLKATSTTRTPTTRLFCLPPEAVDESHRSERILLLLAAALMEATGVQVRVTTDPGLADLDGFVLAADRQALIANWVRTDNVWHTDTVHRPIRLRALAEAAGYARTTAINTHADPERRLAALAEYLGIDWTWITSRCRALAPYSLRQLSRPRNRHLSTDGVDLACRYLGQFAPEPTAQPRTRSNRR